MGQDNGTAGVSLSGIIGVGDERNPGYLEGQIDLIAFLVLFFSLLLVFRTGTSGLINLGDSLFPFFPQETFGRLLYVWDSHQILGWDTSLATTQITWYGLAALLERVGAPLWVINRLWFVLPFLLLGFSMSFLSGVVFGKDKKVSRLIATLFFLFNPFTLNLAAGSNILTLTFAAGVFVFGLLVRGLERQEFDVKNVMLLGLASVFVAGNLVVLALIVILCAFYLVFFLIVNRHDRSRLRHAALYSSATILYSFLVNSWWLLPVVHQAMAPGGLAAQFAAGTDTGTLEFGTEHTSLFNVSRLFYGYQPSYFFPISNYYHYLLSPTVMSVLVLLIFSVSLFKRKSQPRAGLPLTEKFEIFFLLLAWVSVILASGTRPPFGFAYQFLWDHIPYFHIFRTTIRFNLYTMISYGILLGFLYQHAVETRLIASLRNYVRYLLIILIFLSAWPLLSGDIYGQLKPHQIPDDYYQLRNFLKEQEGDFRVMSLPMISWLAAYSWSAPFDMQEILLDFSPKDTVVNMPGYFPDLLEREVTEGDPLYSLAYYYLSQNPSDLAAMSIRGREPTPTDVRFYEGFVEEQALDALRLMGVRYLVVHRDYVIVYHGFPAVDAPILEGNLKSIEGTEFIRSFGDLDVYEVDGFYPRVYSMDGKRSQETPSQLGFKKVSPVEYQIQIKEAREPFDLVFAENFNNGWRLEGIGSPGSELERGFGNVWRIEQTGDYQLRLYYWPQKLLDVGLTISLLSLVGGVIVLIFRKR